MTPSDDPDGYYRFHELARFLRSNCPWDVRQTHRSLVPYLIEETYEVVDAIENLDTGDPAADAALVEELGDLLYQIEFHAAIAEQEGRFTIADVTSGIHDKLVRRHPHLFDPEPVDDDAGSGTHVDEAAINARWDAIKRAEKPERRSIFDGVAGSLPSLSRADAVQSKAAKVGFDWDDADESLLKVREELDEVCDARVAPDGGAVDPRRLFDELGDLLFATVNLARHLDVDPESALRAATSRFVQRFTAVESAAGPDGIGAASRDELLAWWDDAKGATAPDRDPTTS